MLGLYQLHRPEAMLPALPDRLVTETPVVHHRLPRLSRYDTPDWVDYACYYGGLFLLALAVGWGVYLFTVELPFSWQDAGLCLALTTGVFVLAGTICLLTRNRPRTCFAVGYGLFILSGLSACAFIAYFSFGIRVAVP